MNTREGIEVWVKDKKLMVIVSLLVLLGISFFTPAQSQDYIKAKNKFYRSHFRKTRYRYLHACNILKRKKNDFPKRSHYKHKISPIPSVDHNTMVASVDSKLTPVVAAVPNKSTYPKNPKIQEVSAERIKEMHIEEDKVLADNRLPVPSSQEHERVRKLVYDKLASKTNIYPLHLEPLYFNFDEDEFSVVDMEPFLVAAEYAIQGRTVLIEGHTDSRGGDSYNVQLSIKRVEKIRQLMHDIGVPDDRISVVGYGEEIGGHSNTTFDGRQKNRRVDFTIF